MPVRQIRESPYLEAFAYIRPHMGERVSGDTAVIASHENRVLLAVIDALGHGPEAHAVAAVAERYLIDRWAPDPLATLQGLANELSGSRGAAAGIAVVDFYQRRVTYVGVGNTVLRVFGAQPKRLVSAEGILGERYRTPSCQAISLWTDALFVMYTDGVSDRMTVRQSELQGRRSCSHLARSLVDQFGKDHDDATCLVVRCLQ